MSPKKGFRGAVKNARAAGGYTFIRLTRETRALLAKLQLEREMAYIRSRGHVFGSTRGGVDAILHDLLTCELAAIADAKKARPLADVLAGADRKHDRETETVHSTAGRTVHKSPPRLTVHSGEGNGANGATIASLRASESDGAGLAEVSTRRRKGRSSDPPAERG